MKIAHVTPYFHPEFYGSHEAFLSKELARRGHEVVLVTSDEMPRWGGAKGLSSADLSVGESEWQGVRIVRIPAGPTLSFVPSLPSLPKVLRRESFDLFLSHEVFSLAAWHTARAAERAGAPFVLVQHGYHGGRRALFRALFQLEFALLGRKVLRRADQVISLTELCAEFLRNLGARDEQVQVLPTGVDCALFAPQANPQAERMRIGFIGRINQGKGVFDLLDAVVRAQAQLDARHGSAAVQLELEFAGAGEDAEALQARIEELGFAEQAHLVGRLPHAEVPGFIASQAVLCAPTQAVEPFGIVAVEAAAAGVPCVATRIGGLTETVVDGETGLLVEPHDVAGLTNALIALAEDPLARQAMGVKARERALAQYDWPRITDRFEALFDALAASPAG